MLSSKWLLTAVLLQCLCRNLADFGPIILSGSLPHTSSLSGHEMGRQGGRNEEGVKNGGWDQELFLHLHLGARRSPQMCQFEGSPDRSKADHWACFTSILSNTLLICSQHANFLSFTFWTCFIAFPQFIERQEDIPIIGQSIEFPREDRRRAQGCGSTPHTWQACPPS